MSNRKHRSVKHTSGRNSTGSVSSVLTITTNSRIARSIQMKVDETMVLKHKNQLELCKILLQYRDTYAAKINHCIESTIINVLPTLRIINEIIT